MKYEIYFEDRLITKSPELEKVEIHFLPSENAIGVVTNLQGHPIICRDSHCSITSTTEGEVTKIVISEKKVTAPPTVQELDYFEIDETSHTLGPVHNLKKLLVENLTMQTPIYQDIRDNSVKDILDNSNKIEALKSSCPIVDEPKELNVPIIFRGIDSDNQCDPQHGVMHNFIPLPGQDWSTCTRCGLTRAIWR